VKNKAAAMDGDGVHDIFVGAFSAKPFKLQGFELATKGTTIFVLAAHPSDSSV